MTPWTTDFETFLNHMRVNCVILSGHHKRIFEKYKSLGKWYKIPVIFLSSINSVFSLSATNYMTQDTVSLTNSLISLLCSIMVSLAMYLKIEDTMETENSSSRSFYLLSVKIFKVLSLERDHRIVEPKVFLDECLSEYNKLIENSCITNLKLRDKLAPLDGLYIGDSNSVVSSKTCENSDGSCETV